MKNLNQQTEEKLGFHELRSLMEARAATEEGKELCARMAPFRKPALIAAELERVREFRDLLRFEDSFSLDFTSSVQPLLDQAAIAGNWLKAQDLFRLAKWLRMVREIIHYFRQRKEKYPGLWDLVGGLDWKKELLAQIDQLLDERGNVRDDASPELRIIRRQMQDTSAELRRTLQATLRHAISNGWSDANEITIRNDRLVIPVKADFKGKIKGFVHDVSSSGQTIFLEPSSALDANNQLRELQLQEHNEIVKLLSAITAKIHLEVPALAAYIKAVTRVDFTRAKARLAIDMHAEKPLFFPDAGRTMIIKGRHPLLLARRQMRKEDVVPLSIYLDLDQRIILISGPNAGGKSVTLKTIGLMQLMVQSGMLVPADESSEFRYFDKLYIDIGDEQSIQSDLSTYTSHLRNMREMLGGLDGRTLFLMDEFGSGTDPRLGGALAEAFLDRFVATGAFGVVTTHYGNLKKYADQTPGIVNAAMQFDPKTLTPTYQIEVGVPGRSYAFEIAANVGVPAAILKDARDRIEGNELHTEELLLRLEAQRAELEGVMAENKKKNEELKTLLERNKALGEQIKENEAKVMKQAHQKAQAMIDSANAKIERTIKEIRETQAEKERTRELRKELQAMLPTPPPVEEVEEEPVPEVEEVPEVMYGVPVAVGDWVQLKDASSYGQLLDIQAQRAVVALGEMRVTVKLKNLVKIKPPRSPRGYASNLSTLRMGKKANASSELRIQGFRVEQALPVVQRFMDDAILAGLHEVRLLHGKGTGALRESIRELLATIHEVESMEDAHADHGGEGWTVVRLR
jgi:DNA mismatch repair protein MutS2